MTNTPSKLNYRIPAEWELHEATWIGFPHNREDWPGKFTPIQWVYAEIIKKLSTSEKTRILVESIQHEKKAKYILSSSGVNLDNIEFFRLKTDRGWLRDSGPFFIKKGKDVACVNFRFNGWAKYSNYKKDEKVPGFISSEFNLNMFVPEHNNCHVVLEGGAIDINGKGTLITTEECLMDDKVQVRNPGFTKIDYEKVFNDYLGIKNVLWLGRGISGDDTHGHVDDLCRFVNKTTIVLVQEKKSNDDNYKILNENRERVKDFKLEDGSKLELIELPMPEPIIFKGQRLPASYANFYISNSMVLVPTFNDPNDKNAVGILSELFKDRTVTGIHAVDLVWGLGTLHCLTHEQPELK